MKGLWRLRSYPLRYKRRTAIAYLCTVLSIVAAMFVPALLGAAIDEVLSEGLGRQQLWLAAGIVAASAVRGAFGYGQNYLIYSVTENAQVGKPRLEMPLLRGPPPDVRRHLHCMILINP